MTTIDTSQDHERWAELAAGHVLSSLDDADEASYLQHAALCSSCQQLESELNDTLADLAQAPAHVTPPPSLKASIMRAVIEDDEKQPASVVPTSGNRPVIDVTDARLRRRRPKAAWLTAVAAAVVVIVGASLAWGIGGHKQTPVAVRCAQVHCPTIALSANGKQVATVMVLDQIAYMQTGGLPATPSGRRYVLWRISAGSSPVAVAGVRTVPAAGPVKVGSLTVPVSDVTAFALSEENGPSIPAAPTDVLAQGRTT